MTTKAAAILAHTSLGLQRGGRETEMYYVSHDVIGGLIIWHLHDATDDVIVHSSSNASLFEQDCLLMFNTQIDSTALFD